MLAVRRAPDHAAVLGSLDRNTAASLRCDAHHGGWHILATVRRAIVARDTSRDYTLARLDRERAYFVTPRPQIRERFCTSSHWVALQTIQTQR